MKLILHRRILKQAITGSALIGSYFFLVFNAHAHSGLQVPQFDRVEPKPSERIVGGTVVPPGQRTFQVALLQNGRQFCGGAIIADSWVLTAAHCVTSQFQVDQILSGTQTLQQDGQRDAVVQVIPHPGWDINNISGGNDLALIQIGGTFEPDLERLKLATRSVMSTSATPGTAGIVSGWGLTSGGGQASNQLLWTTNTIISDAQCQQVAQGSINSASILCAQDQSRSSCNGDSGGPFTVESGGKTYSVGIVSFGPRSCNGYSAYTETANFNSWISELTGGTADGETPDLLKNNESITLAGSQDEKLYYRFEVTDNVTAYTVSISGGSGDADLYVRKDTRPTDFEFDCRPYIDGNNETCSDVKATPGIYHVMIRAHRSFSNVRLALRLEVNH